MNEEQPKEPVRTDNDLDSIVVGTPTTGQLKIYVNTRTDTWDDIKFRINLLKDAIDYARSKNED